MRTDGAENGKLGGAREGMAMWTWDGVAGAAAPGGAGAAVAGAGVEDAYGRHGERDAQCCSWGEEDADMGRWWRAWWRPGEREWREQGSWKVVVAPQ